MPRLYSPAIQPLMQNLLATLADIDSRINARLSD
jgi:hypothetical protein